jgi:CheY-like chemotaxis protein/glycine cleavage system H lipoate-binding protein
MTDSPKKKILVVDDEITVCKSIRNAIVSDDYEVDTSLSGEEALKKQAEKNYDLVITDLMMPGISGLDLLKGLKDMSSPAKVIMITGYPTIRTAVQSVKMGAFDYLPKPFTPAELRSLVARAFKAAESEEKGLEEPEEVKMPAGLYYMLGHAWMKREESGLAIVGVVYDFLKPIGIITQIDLPAVGDKVSQGEICGKITDAEKFTHRIWSPASGRVVEANTKLKDDPSLLRKGPYEAGWLFRVEPTSFDEDIKGLLLSK